MAELLFAEPQWRAVVRIEEINDGIWTLDECSKKRIYGPSFVDGEYFIGRMDAGGWSCEHGYGFVGPPAPAFLIFEGKSALILATSNCVNEALTVARDRLDLIPAEFLRAMRQKMEVEIAEQAKERAERDARAAIAKAKAAIPKKIGRRRRAIFEESGGKCHYCQTEITLEGRWHVEHKMPKALGGTNEPGNLVASCAPCNHAKRDKTDIEFFALLESRKQAA